MGNSESRVRAGQVYDMWMTPFEAVAMLIDAGLEDREHAVNWLGARLKTNELMSVAIGFEISPDGDVGEEYRYFVHHRAWKHVDKIHWKDDFWISGTYTEKDDYDLIGSSDPIFPGAFDMMGVKFEPDCVRKFVANAINAKQPPAIPNVAKQPSSRRGPKRKDWWDHLWIEMIRRMQAGKLNPKKQADLERELIEYVESELGETVGDSTLKPMASNLFKFLQEKSRRFGDN